MIDFFVNNIRSHENYMNSTINLIASENKLSYLIREALMSDYGNRVAEGWTGQRLFPGLRYYNEIEEKGIQLIKEMFNADFVDVRPISGTMANMVIYTAFTEPGDTIMAPAIKDGGHISMSGSTPKKVFKLNVIPIPMIEKHINIIDKEKTIQLIKEHKPKLLILGGSVILKKLDIDEICNVAHENSTIVQFDASHISGLIVGGEYTNPFDSGVDIITTSTCKTIPGPQHGLILSKEKFAQKIINSTFPALHSGHHLHHTIATFVTMYEMKIFGKRYTRQICKNINELGNCLKKYGFNIYEYSEGKFTDTHMLMILIDNAEFQTSLLERAGIIVNSNMVPWDKSHKQTTAIRIGTPEVTRIGMKEKDMKTIANFIKRVLIDGENPENIAIEVEKFMKKFTLIDYCYDARLWNKDNRNLEEQYV